jgi:dUTP pyrophosphatase
MKTFSDVKYQLNIKILNNDITNYYSKFTNYHNGDSGIDLVTPNDILNIEPFTVSTIDYQIQCEMIDLDTNTLSSYYLVPRSSISKTNLMMANSIGIIDAGYRGNIMAKVRNMNLSINENINKNTCLFQIIAPDLKPIKVNIVNELSITTRNDNGFGSTN